jgi:hypothetical protein
MRQALKDAAVYRAKTGGELVREHKLNVYHTGAQNASIAWRRHQISPGKYGDVIEFAVSLRNPCDQFTNRDGRFYAATEFVSGARTKAKPDGDRFYTVEDWLEHTFGKVEPRSGW